MPDTAPQSTLRQMRGHFARPATWIVLVGVALVVTLLGPFGTGEQLRPLPRAAFWLTHTTANYAIGYLVVPLCRSILARSAPPLVASALAGGIAGLGISLSVITINLAALGYVPTLGETVPLVATVITIAIVVTLVIEVINHELAPTTSARHAPPALLDRLPVEKRGKLVSLSVEDHYVRIRTDKGEEMILLRLSDALREVGDVRGLQVHRSHWVALDQVTAARREGDRAILILRHGPDIPVSRTNVPAIKEAGLLPR